MDLMPLDRIATSPPSVFIRPITQARWHVIWTEPRAEDRAIRDIRHLGFECYCPVEISAMEAQPPTQPRAAAIPALCFCRIRPTAAGLGADLSRRWRV